MKIIALKGRHDSGKTTTLNFVYQQLLNKDWQPIPGEYLSQLVNENRDFRDILIKDGVILGIETRGDRGDWLRKDLQYLESKKCSIVICACRTRGDSRTAVKEHQHVFFNKTVSIKANSTANELDAKKIFDLLS